MIFKMQKHKPKQEQETHILLLTDGAVSNTPEIVNFVRKHANLTNRVHTFGLGNGADVNLIKQTAYAGFGQHYFVYNESQIEEKVIMAMTNTHLDYQVLSELEIFNSANQKLDIDFHPQHVK